MSESAARTQSPGFLESFQTYVRTKKGTILLVEIVLCIIVLICYAASRYPGYLTVAICEMVFAIIIFVVYMRQFHKDLSFIHWPWTDFIRAAIGSVLFLITSLIVVIRNYDGAGIAGGVFGILAGILFAYDAYTIIPSLRSRHTQAATEPSDGV
ncbi:proteolipid protein 2 [Microcaecilia unicolor]|uniref:Proteolipid protein 2 n=1 Tax=Microcaecilia unicolor TaxID=1415580 RepID=A0A6P7XHG3_9AMPH|nr:proteolipid protein 2 [Microcaecilia unicolor]